MLERVKAGTSPSSKIGEGSTIRIVAMRTGLPMETLRAWERRYGFPAPARRPGSNRRLYSASEVAKLVAITRVLARGYRIGDVVAKSRSELDTLAGAPGDGAIDSPATVAKLLALLAEDRIVEVERELHRAATAAGPQRFVVDLAHPLAVRIGEAWAKGEISVRHEHLATECLDTELRRMLVSFRDTSTSPHVLLATLPGEEHTLALEMVALYLAARGARPRLMGGQTPVDELAAGARALAVDAVGLTVMACGDRTATRRAIKSLRKALPRHVRLWIGGSGAEALEVHTLGAGGPIRIATSWDRIDAAVADAHGKRSA